MVLDIHTSLAELATRFPSASRLFHDRGLDFCCGGNRSLDAACTAQGLDPRDLLKDIESLEAPPAEQRWDQQPLTKLIDHLLTTFHESHRQEVPKLVAMAHQVEQAHAEKSSCPMGLARHLEMMDQSLEEHMQKEEQVLFPLIASGRGASATMPVRIMLQEHDEHAANLKRTRQITSDFKPPADACPTWRALYLRLEQLERDIMEHVHLENNILFPGALQERMPA